jgi:hypothetical protein
MGPMTEQESPRRELAAHVDATSEGSFGELAKGLATGTVSRRKALRWLGAALVGGELASVPGAAWASHKGTPHGSGGGGGGGKSACAKYCRTLFGRDTTDQGECNAQGTKGTGPCFAYGGPGNPAPSCNTNQTPNPNTCQCEATSSTCGPSTCPETCPNTPCGPIIGGCRQTTEGQQVCVTACVASFETCTSSSSCPSGYVCVNLNTGAGPLCYYTCT